MSTNYDTPPSSSSESAVPEAEAVKASSHGNKRQRSVKSAPPGDEGASQVSPSATDIATSKPSPWKRRKQDPEAAAEEAAAKQKRQEGKAARKAASDKKQEEEARIKAANKRKREEVAAKRKTEKEAADKAKANKKYWKEKWEEYVKEHDLGGATVRWSPDDEPGSVITQSDAGVLYTLKPNELTCLRHCPEPNPHNTRTVMKLFDHADVRKLGFRKRAMLVGVPAGETEQETLARGEELWREE